MAFKELKTVKSYQDGAYPFPKDEIPEKEKNSEWCLKWCEAIYASWVTDQTGTHYSKQTEMYDLRKYGAGEQNIKKYQDILLDPSENGKDTEGYLNINWDIFSVMPKFKHIIRGIFEEQEHAIVATAVDPKSIEDRDLQKLRKWFKGRYKPVIDAVNSLSGKKPEPEWLPESVDELELYQSTGGFKMAKETEIEEALTYTFYISEWKEIKRKMLDDFADINCSAVKDFTDPYTKKAKIRYVDPAKLIIQYSRHWDHRNSEFAGEIIQESITNIRKNTNLSEEELRTLAQTYNGRNSNRNLENWDPDSLSLMNNSGWKYDNFYVDVLDAEWFSVNEKFFTTRTNERGDTLTYQEFSGKRYDTEKKKTTSKRYKTVYRAKWIIGTDFVYDDGIQYDIPRPGKKEVELSFKFYKLPGRSIVSLAMPNLDQIQLTWLKLQNALAMSANSGIAVEYTSLMNMTLGGKKMQPLEILSIRRDTGDYIYKLTTHQGRQNTPSGMRPVQELTGGIGPQLNEFISLFDLNLNFIRDLTGINQIADASNPNPNQSVGGAEMAIAATNNALKPLYSGYIRLKEMVARSAALRIQLLMRYDNDAYQGYIPAIGGAGVKILSVGTDVIDADFSIMIQAKPTQQRRQMILEAAIKATQPDRDGNIGIETQDFMMIERLLESGNEKLAEITLAHRTRKNKEKQLQIQRENMQLDSENQQKAAIVKSQEEMKKLEMDYQFKTQFEEKKSDLESKRNAELHQYKLEELALQNHLDQSQIQKTA